MPYQRGDIRVSARMTGVCTAVQRSIARPAALAAADALVARGAPQITRML